MANTVGAEPWLKLAASWIEDRVAQGRTLSADDLHAHVGTPPTAGLPAVAIRRARLCGLITPVGMESSNRTAARSHLVRIWGPR